MVCGAGVSRCAPPQTLNDSIAQGPRSNGMHIKSLIIHLRHEFRHVLVDVHRFSGAEDSEQVDQSERPIIFSTENSGKLVNVTSEKTQEIERWLGKVQRQIGMS